MHNLKSSLLVGNDIVDLQESSRIGSFHRPGFAFKALHPSEQESLSAYSNKEVLFWMFWAAKEAAYKVVSKMRTLNFFSPKKYVVQINQLSRTGVDQLTANLKVQFSDISVSVDVYAQKKYVHAIGQLALEVDERKNQSLFFNLQSIDSFQKIEEIVILENGCTFRQYSEASRLVRYLCIQHIANLLKLAPERLKIIRHQEKNTLGPPQVYFDEIVFPVDISLSHHGDWVAWAFSISS